MARKSWFEKKARRKVGSWKAKWTRAKNAELKRMLEGDPGSEEATEEVTRPQRPRRERKTKWGAIVMFLLLMGALVGFFALLPKQY